MVSDISIDMFHRYQKAIGTNYVMHASEDANASPRGSSENTIDSGPIG